MSYTKGKWELHNTAKDSIVGEDNISLAFTDAWNRAPEENEANAKRIVHCLNNYDGLVEACKKTIILISGEHFKYNDTITLGHIEILQMLKDRLEQAIAKAEEE